MTLTQIQNRVTALEKKVAELERRKPENGRPRTGKWWIDQAGAFAGDPVYAEIVRLGRKYRESLRPKPRTRKKKPR